jgi:hypothetical protein
MEITVAHAGGPGAYQDFSGAGTVNPHFFNFQGPIHLTKNCSFHGLPPLLDF